MNLTGLSVFYIVKIVKSTRCERQNGEVQTLSNDCQGGTENHATLSLQLLYIF